MENVVIQTPVGEMTVVKNPDPDYPGVWVKVNGRDLVLVEYDKEADKHFARIWTKKRDEDGNDPIAKIDLESDE